MLNRTNLTLSALSNRLNLGTRSLVLATSVNNGGQTLRIRPSSHDHVMRDGTKRDVAWFHAFMKLEISPRRGSILPAILQRPVRCGRPVSGQSATAQAAAAARERLARAAYAAAAAA